MNLQIRVRKRLPHFDLDVEFVCQAEKMTVLIGPSGAGKTTLIRIIAGLEKPDEGIIQFGDEVWMDTDRRICLPPQKRRLGYVFQDYTLFPHLSIQDNAAFAAGKGRKPSNSSSSVTASGNSETENRMPYRVGNASVAPSARPWPGSRGCSCSTNPFPPWMSSPAGICGMNCVR